MKTEKISDRKEYNEVKKLLVASNPTFSTKDVALMLSKLDDIACKFNIWKITNKK